MNGPGREMGATEEEPAAEGKRAQTLGVVKVGLPQQDAERAALSNGSRAVNPSPACHLYPPGCLSCPHTS